MFTQNEDLKGHSPIREDALFPVFQVEVSKYSV